MVTPRRPLVTALVAVMLATAAGVARANPLDTYGFGARSSALGGAVSADVADFSASYYNPAGLVRAEALRLDLGYFLVDHSLYLNARDTNVDDVSGLVFGVVAPGRLGPLPFAVGLATHINDERLSRTRSLPQVQPRWEMYDNRTHRIFIGANLAVRPLPWLLLGGGIAFMSTSRSDLTIGGEVSLDSPEYGSDLYHSIVGELVTVRYPHIGLQIAPNDSWAVGLAYRGEFQLRLAVDAELAGDIVIGEGTTAEVRIPAYFRLISDSVSAFLPQQVSLGVAWRPSQRWRLAVDVTWVDWSAYMSPVAIADVALRIDVPAEFSYLIHIPSSIAGTTPLPPRFADRLVPRVGVEWTALSGSAVTLELRGGYFYEASPAPAQTGATNFVDCDRHAFSIGAGLALHGLTSVLPGDLVVDVYAQWSKLASRMTTKSSLVDPIGDYEASGSILGAGVTVGATFP